MKKYAIIPARGGSKRITGKNIREILGKPIIVHVIEKAIISGLFDKVFVTTDSLEIAEIAINAGAEVPFIRSPELSNDFAGTHEVILDCINKLPLNIDMNDLFVCIYPTSILVEASDIQSAMNICISKPDKYVFAAHQPNTSPWRSFTVNSEGEMEFLFPEFADSRSQDLESCFVDSGQFYVGTTKTWRSQADILGSGSKILEISNLKAIDVNTEDDWKFLQLVLKSD